MSVDLSCEQRIERAADRLAEKLHWLRDGERAHELAKSALAAAGVPELLERAQKAERECELRSDALRSHEQRISEWRSRAVAAEAQLADAQTAAREMADLLGRIKRSLIDGTLDIPDVIHAVEAEIGELLAAHPGYADGTG